jgi:hypothetical protein
MDNNTSEHLVWRVSLSQDLQKLAAELQALESALLNESTYPTWIWQQDLEKARPYAAEIITALEYAEDQDPQRTRICPGLLAASQDTLDKVFIINDLKDKITATLRQMDCIKVKVFSEERHKEVEEPLSKVALAALGRARLHRRQVLRHLEVLPLPPQRLGFSWAQTRKIQRIHFDEAEKMLEEKRSRFPEDRYLDHQLRLLAELPRDEPLAYVEAPHLHPRVNIVLNDGRKLQKRGTLPLFYLGNPGDKIPKLIPLAEKPKEGAKKQRRDRIVEDLPYLPSIHVHRYRQK